METNLFIHSLINKYLFSTYCVPKQNKHPRLHGAYMLMDGDRSSNE